MVMVTMIFPVISIDNFLSTGRIRALPRFRMRGIAVVPPSLMALSTERSFQRFPGDAIENAPETLIVLN
jgi:hypothetical protein